MVLMVVLVVASVVYKIGIYEALWWPRAEDVGAN